MAENQEGIKLPRDLMRITLQIIFTQAAKQLSFIQNSYFSFTIVSAVSSDQIKFYSGLISIASNTDIPIVVDIVIKIECCCNQW